jgi:murein DD-endopeptidase MepM/ murein hydrolase activator NlpD
MNRTTDPLQNLADAASEDVVAASPAALAAEAAQERGAGDAFALDFDRILVRAGRQARWRRFAQGVRTFASALAWQRSWRPVLAGTAGLAVVVVAGDLIVHQRTSAPAVPSEPISAESPRAPADKIAPQLSFGTNPDAEVKHFTNAAVPPAPPPAPPAKVTDAPKPVRTVPIRIGEASHDAPAGQARSRARAVPPLLSPSDRDGALSLAQEDNSRAATFQRKAASQPSASRLAAAPAEPAPAAGYAPMSGGSPSFIWPLRGALIASFGAETNGRPNDGIDIAAPVGSDIHAADDGVVVHAGNDIKGYGNLVLVRHSDGFVTAYAYADKILVKLNDVVHRGQVIAKSGRDSRGPLLHFEIRKGSTPIDPTPFLPRG